VRCAVEVQRGMVERDAAIPPDQRIEFRIGINLGDVIADGDDIFGDGVNIAARLEALAEPGGICISRTVRDQVLDKLPYAFDDMGERALRNIARPVSVYALGETAGAALPPVTGPARPRAPRRASTRRRELPRLSIVVLPLANLSNDPDQEYFADGITDDLTTDLSRISGSFIISRNTAFTYKGKPTDAKQIGRELGVRYLLEGSVRRIGEQVRVNVQLIDSETGAHLWADRFDRDMGDIFALQNEITGRIANELNLELVRMEAARPTDHPEALDYIFRGRAAYNRGSSREGFAEAIDQYERALVLDPGSVEAQSLLAGTLANRVNEGKTDSAAADIERAEGLIKRALATSPLDPLAHYAKGALLRAQKR